MHFIIVDFRLTRDCSLQVTTGSAYELTATMTTICRRDDFHHLKFIIRSRLSRKMEKDDREHSYCVVPNVGHLRGIKIIIYLSQSPFLVVNRFI